MRTEKGAERIADLRSYLQTTAKHGIQALAPSPCRSIQSAIQRNVTGDLGIGIAEWNT